MVDKWGNDCYVTVYRSDRYPDLEFVEYDYSGSDEFYARAINEATTVTIPYEVYFEGYWYDEDENGDLTIRENVDNDGNVQYYALSEYRTVKGVDFDKNTSLVSIELEEGIQCVRCYQCTSLREVKLPNTITDLSKSCWDYMYGHDLPTPGDDYTDVIHTDYYGSFMGCSSLESITIPLSVEKIDGAFIDCTSLKSVTFLKNEWDGRTPSNFSTMYYTFAGCSSLERIELPSGVNSLGGTFQGCTSLIDVGIPITVTELNGTFQNCTSLPNATFLSGKSYIKYMYASFKGCTGLETAVVPEGVESISEAFYGCTNLKTVTINSQSLNNMESAFYGCKSLQNVKAYDVLDEKMHSDENSVYIPSTVENLRNAFSYCSKIEQVIFANNCAFCQYYNNPEFAFYGCANLNHVVLPQNLQGIAIQMFGDCSSLKEITIPENVERIRSGAFSGCTSLETITFEGRTPPFVDREAFSNAEQDKKGEAPLGSMNNYKKAFKNCNAYNKKNGFGQIVFSSSPSEVIIVGDVNGDYQISIADVTALVNIILGKTDQYNQTAADVNGDGDITIADVTALVNIILGKSTDEIPAFVDLGLPSGTLWATCNVGAEWPEDFGDYFAWGEADGYESGKETFDWSTYKWCEGTSTTLTKYNSNESYGIVDGKTVLDLEDDAAYTNVGSEWCMPTSEQFAELINSEYTTTEWTKQNWAFGYRITSKTNGNSIFLPAAGYYAGSGVLQEGAIGAYWSSSLGTRASSPAILLEFSSSFCARRDGNPWNGENRSNGGSVRPVLSSPR